MFMTVDKSFLLSDLRRLACEVLFQKADGTNRKMRCTLNPAYMPEPEFKTLPVQDQSANIVVWDLEKNNWRTVPTNRVYSIQQVNTV